jgi:acetate kinase
MGFTPLEGLMMGTRSGSVDPGILLYLMREQGLGADELDKMLNKESGLKGLSGVSNDMRLLQEAIAQGHPQAKLAFEVYIHRIRTSVGAMLASLGRLDALVFTAGIGEHSEAVRSRVCAGFDFLGLAIDDTLNQQHPKDTDIATADSPVRVLVIHTQEDWQIARTCWQKMHTNCQPT